MFIKFNDFLHQDRGDSKLVALIIIVIFSALIGFLIMGMLPIIALSVVLQGLGPGADVANALACNAVSKFAIKNTAGLLPGIGDSIKENVDGFCSVMDALDESGLNKEVKKAFDCATQETSQNPIDGENCTEGAMGYGDEISTAIPKQAQWLIPIYQKAADKYKIPWQVLAAVNQQETNFGLGNDWRVDNGYDVWGFMQFQTPTWNGLKEDAGYAGDVHHDGSQPCPRLKSKKIVFKKDGKADRCDPVDAIFTAAKKISADGGKGNLTWKFKGCPKDGISRALAAYYGACGNGQADYVNEVHEKYLKIVAGTKKDPNGGAAAGTVPDNDNIVQFKAGMTIDTDGIGASHGDCCHQNQTSYANGKLNADKTNYIALAPGWSAARGIKLGDVVLVQWKGRAAYAIYADNYSGSAEHGEGSWRLARMLGIAGRTAESGKAKDNEVSYAIYKGSNRKINGSVDQNKINKVGAELFGGVTPTPGATDEPTPQGSSSSDSAEIGSKEQVCDYKNWKPVGKPSTPNGKIKKQPLSTKYYTSDGTTGRSDVIAANYVVAKMWKLCHPNWTKQNAFFNDMNATGHASHHNGADQDINFPMAGAGVTNYVSGGVYHREWAKQLASMFYRAGAYTIIFDDTSIHNFFAKGPKWGVRGNMVNIGGHDNHFHVRWYPNSCGCDGSTKATGVSVWLQGQGSGSDEGSAKEPLFAPDSKLGFGWGFGF